MAVADFLERKFDLLAWRNAELGVDTLVTPLLLDPSSDGEVCVGIQKLAQRFLVELLTPQGSIKYMPDRGTNLLTALLYQSGRLSSDIFAAFAIAEVEARTNLLAEETDDDPDDERYGSSQLLEVALQATAVRLTIQMTSRAGTDVKFIAPLPIVP